MRRKKKQSQKINNIKEINTKPPKIGKGKKYKAPKNWKGKKIERQKNY